MLTKMRNDPNKIHGPELRMELLNRIYGVGFKLTSLFFRVHGYEDIVPLDAWAINYVRSRGCVNDGIPPIDKWAEHYVQKNGRIVHSPNSGGVTVKQGLAYEKVLTHYARTFRASPALFQATIYARWSTWRVDAGAKPFYLQYL